MLVCILLLFIKYTNHMIIVYSVSVLCLELMQGVVYAILVLAIVCLSISLNYQLLISLSFINLLTYPLPVFISLSFRKMMSYAIQY